MSESYDVGSAKSRFSDLLNRAGYRGERFLIRKRGRPIAAIVSAEDLARLEQASERRTSGLLEAAVGLREYDDFPVILDEIVRDRENSMDRPVNIE